MLKRVEDREQTWPHPFSTVSQCVTVRQPKPVITLRLRSKLSHSRESGARETNFGNNILDTVKHLCHNLLMMNETPLPTKIGRAHV